MQIISIVNQKGGCGKTTTAVNLAYILSKRGQRVMLIDLDPQAHASFSLGLTPGLTAADLLEAVVSNRSFNLQDFLIDRADNLSVLGSSIGLSALEHTLSEQKNKLEIVTQLLTGSCDLFAYCIIDCPPNLGILTLNALLASTYSIVPIGICQMSLRGVENLDNILEMLLEHGRKIPTLLYLLTQVDKRLRYSEQFVGKAQQKLGAQLLSTMIRTNVHLREAAGLGKSIYEYKRDSRGSQDYGQLAEEIENIASNNISKIEFSFKGNDLNEVYLVGEFNNWQKNKDYRLEKTGPDNWRIVLPLKRGTYRYKFITDEEWINDPQNSLAVSDSFGGKNSILFVR